MGEGGASHFNDDDERDSGYSDSDGGDNGGGVPTVHFSAPLIVVVTKTIEAHNRYSCC